MTTDLAKLQKRMKNSVLGHAVLWLLSLAYGAAVLVRYALYHLKILKRKTLPAKVICIGNLTTGGTGKTSAVLLAVEDLLHKKAQVAILSRGYKRPSRTQPITVLRQDHEVSWKECGDEAWMIHQALRGKNVPILISPDRYKAGSLALSQFKSEVLLMDDGFQHLGLHRDLDIVLVDGRDPFGANALLPLGRLREPRKALRRAGLILITHSDQTTKEEMIQLKSDIGHVNAQAPILETVHEPQFFLDLKRNQKIPLSEMKGQEVVSLAAIGHPESFEDTLRAAGVILKQIWRYPDHHPYQTGEIQSIENLRGSLPLVTTFKDFPRLPEGWQDVLKSPALALTVKLKVLKGRKIWEELLEL